MVTRWGEMLDLIACLNVYNGAEPAADDGAAPFAAFDAQMEVE